MTIKLSKEQKIQVVDARDIYKVMQQILLRSNKIDRKKEHLWIVCLAANHEILLIELVSLGSRNSTIAEPTDIFSFALQKQAAKIVMVHNHPSDQMHPSKTDIENTDKMLAVGDFLNLPVIDHLIISEKAYYSFAKTGLLKKIADESRYDLTFKQIDILKAELKEMANKKAREIAKRSLTMGLSVEQVIQLSGLTQKQVESINKRLTGGLPKKTPAVKKRGFNK